MSQEEKRPATRKAPRTQIEDLPRPLEALSEEEAALAIGGTLICQDRFKTSSGVEIGVMCENVKTQAETCTAGNALQASDQDSNPDPDAEYLGGRYI
jgi:hypothetical protein